MSRLGTWCASRAPAPMSSAWTSGWHRTNNGIRCACALPKLTVIILRWPSQISKLYKLTPLAKRIFDIFVLLAFRQPPALRAAILTTLSAKPLCFQVDDHANKFPHPTVSARCAAPLAERMPAGKLHDQQRHGC